MWVSRLVKKWNMDLKVEQDGVGDRNAKIGQGWVKGSVWDSWVYGVTVWARCRSKKYRNGVWCGEKVERKRWHCLKREGRNQECEWRERRSWAWWVEIAASMLVFNGGWERWKAEGDRGEMKAGGYKYPLFAHVFDDTQIHTPSETWCKIASPHPERSTKVHKNPIRDLFIFLLVALKFNQALYLKTLSGINWI